VAVIGSVYASLYGNRLNTTLPHLLPSSAKDTAHQSVGGAYAVAQHLTSSGQAALGRALHDAAADAFIHGISIACLVAGGVAVAGALLTARFLPAQPPSQPDDPAAHPSRSHTHPRPTVSVAAKLDTKEGPA
jgi:hypothetical protein